MILSQKAYKDFAREKISPIKNTAAVQLIFSRNWRILKSQKKNEKALTIPAKTSDAVPVLKQQLVGVDSHASNLNI